MLATRITREPVFNPLRGFARSAAESKGMAISLESTVAPELFSLMF
jgi:hypothetical protein